MSSYTEMITATDILTFTISNMSVEFYLNNREYIYDNPKGVYKSEHLDPVLIPGERYVDSDYNEIDYTLNGYKRGAIYSMDGKLMISEKEIITHGSISRDPGYYVNSHYAICNIIREYIYRSNPYKDLLPRYLQGGSFDGILTHDGWYVLSDCLNDDYCLREAYLLVKSFINYKKHYIYHVEVNQSDIRISRTIDVRAYQYLKMIEENDDNLY